MGLGAVMRRHALFLAVIFCALAAAFLPQGAPTGFDIVTQDSNPDLKPLNITYAPVGPQTGDTVTFSVPVKNVGDAGTGSSFGVALYIDGSSVGTGTVSALGAGETGTATITWTATSELHDAYAAVDSAGAIAESDETNNRLNSSVAVDWPTRNQNNERWAYANMNGPTTNHSVWSKALGDGPSFYYTLLAADGRIIATTGNNVYVINATTGINIWNITDGTADGATDLTVARGILFISSYYDKAVYAYNVSTGAQLWNASTYKTPYFVSYYNGLLLQDNESQIVARNPITGSVAWTYTPPNETGWTSEFLWFPPAIYNDTMYMASTEMNSSGSMGEAFAISAVNGNLIWRNNSGLGKIYTMPSVGYNNVFFGDRANSLLYAFNMFTGRESWLASWTVGDDFNSIIALYNGIAYFIDTSLYARNISTGAQSWSAALEGAGSYYSGPVQTKNGMLFYGSSNGVWARSTSDGSLLWQYKMSKPTYALLPYNGLLYTLDSNGKLYAFGPKQNMTASQTYNDTIVDRDSVSSADADAAILTASLLDGGDAKTIDFYYQQLEPTVGAETYLNSNDSINGAVTYAWNPDGTIAAGRYKWWPSSSDYNTLSNSTVRIYGGMNASFRYASTFPRFSYNGTDDLTAISLISFGGGEILDTMRTTYNFKYNISLTKPAGSKLVSGLYNQTDVSVTTQYLANGTAFACFEPLESAMIDFDDEIIPDLVPAFETKSNYYFKWTCSAATCPSYNDVEYLIYKSRDSGSPNGTDEFYLHDITCPGGGVNGWTFTVFNNTSISTSFWNGTITLTGETGTWNATLNATADFFFTNDTVYRNFTIAAAEAAAAATPSGGSSGVFRNISMEPKNNILIEAGKKKLMLGRGAAEPITINVTNKGNVVLQDIILTADGLPYGWVTFPQMKIDSLWPNEVWTAKASINVPDIAPLGEYALTFKANNYYTSVSSKLEVTITDDCEPCLAPGAWSGCIGNMHSRTNYRCSSETDYRCAEWTEEESCAPLLSVENTPILLMMIIIGGVVIGRFYWKNGQVKKNGRAS